MNTILAKCKRVPVPDLLDPNRVRGFSVIFVPTRAWTEIIANPQFMNYISPSCTHKEIIADGKLFVMFNITAYSDAFLHPERKLCTDDDHVYLVPDELVSELLLLLQQEYEPPNEDLRSKFRENMCNALGIDPKLLETN